MVYPRVSQSRRREFWRLIASGVSTEAAADAIGVARSNGKRWFVEAGGMSPVELREPSGRYLGPADREVIGLRWRVETDIVAAWPSR